MRPSFTCPKPWPPSSRSRWAAQRPRCFTSSCNGRTARSRVSWSRFSVSRGKTSSRTNSRIHASFASNSGSVSKSQAIRARLPPGQFHQPLDGIEVEGRLHAEDEMGGADFEEGVDVLDGVGTVHGHGALDGSRVAAELLAPFVEDAALGGEVLDGRERVPHVG